MKSLCCRMSTLMMNLQKSSYLPCALEMIRRGNGFRLFFSGRNQSFLFIWLMRSFNLHNVTCCLCSGSLFTNSNWFAFDDEKAANERSVNSIASPSPDGDDDVIIGEADEFSDTAASSAAVDMETEDSTSKNRSGNPSEPEAEKSPAWVEWRETSESTAPSSNPDEATIMPNGEVQTEKEDTGDDTDKKSAEENPPPDTCDDETTEKSLNASGVATTESSPDAASCEAEIAEKLKESSCDASKQAAESHEKNAESSEPAFPQETEKSEEAEVDDAKESKEAVKEPEKVV